MAVETEVHGTGVSVVGLLVTQTWFLRVYTRSHVTHAWNTLAWGATG